MKRCLAPLLLLSLLPAHAVQQPSKPSLPTVVLVGDSIRNGYAPLVTRLLDGKARVVSVAWAGDSAALLANLDKLVLDHKPDLVHFNAGLHDLRVNRKDKSHQIALAAYEKNLNALVARLKKSKATLLFASTTPIDDDRHAKRGFDRFEKDVRRYNEAALRVMAREGVIVHDLHALAHHHGAARLLGKDGTHYTKEGNAVLAAAVADSVLRHLAVRASRPAKLPSANAEATARYKKDEAERDAKVPEVFRKMKVPELAIPADEAEWKKRRPGVLKAVVGSLGDRPERPKPSARLVAREVHPLFVLESLTIPNGVDGRMTAMMLLPHKRAKKAAGILWLHSSSYDRHHLLMPGHNGGDEPLGEAFARAGYVVLAPDASWYGGRAGAGPAGEYETARAQQDSQHKYHLWFGRTLWGMFVHDDQVALDYFCARPEVDVKRIGATGISMGSTRSWWLAAVDDRIACAVGVACLTRYQDLLRHGQLRQHGVYYFVNGLLKHFDVEGVLALIAPRPFLALTGELDAGSPADGIRVLEDRVGKVYGAVGAKGRFRSVRYADTGHVYTPAMRKEMLAWFGKWLGAE